MVPEHLAEVSSKILMYLNPNSRDYGSHQDLDEESTKEMTFTAEELEALKPIAEEASNPPFPRLSTAFASIRTQEPLGSRERVEPFSGTPFHAVSNEIYAFCFDSIEVQGDLGGL